jgi:glycerol-3-phosphate cytidylyltransferase
MILYSGGTYDMLHFGHINFLKRCRELVGPKGKVIVSLNTDEFVKEFKHKSPIMTYEERKKSLLACQYVDRVIKNTGGQDSKPAIRKIKPDIIAVGTDFARKDYYKQMSFTQDWLDKKNIILAYIPYTWKISSTILRERLLANK